MVGDVVMVWMSLRVSPSSVACSSVWVVQVRCMLLVVLVRWLIGWWLDVFTAAAVGGSIASADGR